MVKQIIPADAYKTRKVFQKDGENYLNISEFFYNTIQGEGIYTGHPAAFLRLAGCTLSCNYCDTEEVWMHGSPYTFDELFTLMNSTMLIPKLQAGHHLILTGGSPLLQQERLARFLMEYECIYEYRPFIEIENECVIMPNKWLTCVVNCWNNSPKLSSSGVPKKQRYKPEVIKFTSQLVNSWFKFVVDSYLDWEEIEEDFINPGYIDREQVILMPKGATRTELEDNRLPTMNMAIEHNVRYSDRLHIQAWDKTVGV